jgi:hypothetical protein
MYFLLVSSRGAHCSAWLSCCFSFLNEEVANLQDYSSAKSAELEHSSFSKSSSSCTQLPRHSRSRSSSSPSSLYIPYFVSNSCVNGHSREFSNMHSEQVITKVYDSNFGHRKQGPLCRGLFAYLKVSKPHLRHTLNMI